jgi:hypothetical protein
MCCICGNACVARAPRTEASSDSQESTEHPSLPMQILPRDPEYLALAYHPHCLDRLNHRPRPRCRPRPLHGSQPPLDVTMIRFDPIVTVAPRTLTAMWSDVSFSLQFPYQSRIAPQPFPGEHLWRAIVRVGQCLL